MTTAIALFNNKGGVGTTTLTYHLPAARVAADRLWVVPGDLGLSGIEDRLSDAWQRGFLGDEGAIRITTAFHRIIAGCAAQVNADVVLLDTGPNLGAINRAALLASDDLVVPLTADVFSLQGLRSLGAALRDWRHRPRGRRRGPVPPRACRRAGRPTRAPPLPARA